MMVAGPVDRSLKRDEMVVALAAVVVNVRRDQIFRRVSMASAASPRMCAWPTSMQMPRSAPSKRVLENLDQVRARSRGCCPSPRAPPSRRPLRPSRESPRRCGWPPRDGCRPARDARRQARRGERRGTRTEWSSRCSARPPSRAVWLFAHRCRERRWRSCADRCRSRTRR